MATLSLMPVWGFIYVRALTDGPEVVAGPLGEGVEVYSNCAGCHGADGGGGVGLRVHRGRGAADVPATSPTRSATSTTAPRATTPRASTSTATPTGRAARTSPASAASCRRSVSSSPDAEIVAVVCHERYTIGGADPTSEEFADEYEAWCSPESPLFEGLEAGDVRPRRRGDTPRCSTPRASRSTPASSARCRHPPADDRSALLDQLDVVTGS